MLRTNLAVGVAGAVFGIAGEMRRLPAYFDNPGRVLYIYWNFMVFMLSSLSDVFVRGSKL